MRAPGYLTLRPRLLLPCASPDQPEPARAALAGAGCLLALALGCTTPGLAHAAPGVVETVVSGVRDGRGHVLVAVCTRQDFLREHCAYNGSAPAQPGTVVVRVGGVPPGTYAVQAWQDENDNGRIDRNLLGIPREGIGFSRDAPIRLGPPSFEDAQFEVGPNGGQTTLKLRYLRG